MTLPGGPGRPGPRGGVERPRVPEGGSEPAAPRPVFVRRRLLPPGAPPRRVPGGLPPHGPGGARRGRPVLRRRVRRAVAVGMAFRAAERGGFGCSDPCRERSAADRTSQRPVDWRDPTEAIRSSEILPVVRVPVRRHRGAPLRRQFLERHSPPPPARRSRESRRGRPGGPARAHHRGGARPSRSRGAILLHGAPLPEAPGRRLTRVAEESGGRDPDLPPPLRQREHGRGGLDLHR